MSFHDSESDYEDDLPGMTSLERMRAIGEHSTLPQNLYKKQESIES